MKKYNFHLYQMFLLIMFLLTIQGCAMAQSNIKKEAKTVRIGMTKEEVLAIWGEPSIKIPPEPETSIAYNEER